MPLKTLFVTFCLIFNVFFLFRYEERLAVSVTNLAKTSLEADKLQKVKKSREFELISTSNFRGYRMRDCKKIELISTSSWKAPESYIINNWLPPRQRMRRPKRAQSKARRTILWNSSWKMRSILSQSPKTSNSSQIWFNLSKLLVPYICLDAMITLSK